ncbi:Homoserine dehydrogenase, partial [Spiromyces aspiralis]
MTLRVAIVGPGLVGAALVEQLLAYRTSSQYASLPIKLAGVINTKGMLFEDALDAIGSIADLQSAMASAPASDLEQFTAAFAKNGPAVVVDCTSSDSVAAKYPAWLRQGLSVVTPNKKGFSGPQSLFDEIQALSQNPAGPYVYHESTVGAGLPVLSTLNDL